MPGTVQTTREREKCTVCGSKKTRIWWGKRQVNRQLELVSAKGKSGPGPNEVFIHLIFASEAQ